MAACGAAVVLTNLVALFPAMRHATAYPFLSSELVISGIVSAVYHWCSDGGPCWGVEVDSWQQADFFFAYWTVSCVIIELAHGAGGAWTETGRTTSSALVLLLVHRQWRFDMIRALVTIGVHGALFVLAAYWSRERHGSTTIDWIEVFLGILLFGIGGAIVSTLQTGAYCIWHSIWHVLTYVGAFFILDARKLWRHQSSPQPLRSAQDDFVI